MAAFLVSSRSQLGYCCLMIVNFTDHSPTKSQWSVLSRSTIVRFLIALAMHSANSVFAVSLSVISGCSLPPAPRSFIYTTPSAVRSCLSART
jgi:hypothetical protein